MMHYTDAQAAIRLALADGPLHRAELEERLRNAGKVAALDHLVKIVRAGFIGALDIDDEAGNRIDTLFYSPEDALWVLYGWPRS